MSPNTTVTLYATDFDISNRYVIAADSEADALAVVGAYPSKVFSNCYWQRTDSFVFRANGNINDIEKYNYCVFQNDGKNNFAFITKCQYVNDAMTWVYLEIDPWLNFAGQYVFHDSLIRRGHPRKGLIDIDDTTEPVDNLIFQFNEESWGLYENDQVYKWLVTSLKATSIPDQTAVADYWNGMLDLLTGASAQTLITWSQTMDAGYTKIGNTCQANTSCGDTAIDRIVSAFIQNGLQSALIACYHVPASMYTYGLTIDATEFEIKEKDILLSTASSQPAMSQWDKLRCSPQFRQIYINCGGNVKEVPAAAVNALLMGQQDIPIKIYVDPSMNGGFSAFVNTIYFRNTPKNQIVARSPVWDRIPIVGYGIDAASMKETALKGGQLITNGVTDVIKTLTNPMNMINPAGIIGGLAETAVDIAGDVFQNRIDLERTVMSGAVQIGGNAGQMASYNKTCPLFMAWITEPCNTMIGNIAKYFGTYGYMYNPVPRPITFKDYPYWKYYECFDASITGSSVPQKYLNQVIAMFNRGVFVFNDAANYKHFENAINNHL